MTALPASAAYFNFEAGHVRPLALSPDASQLFAVNTPDNRLAIFDVDQGGLTLAAEVPVGLRRVAVAVRDAGGGALEAWVINHLSDSLSIIAIDPVDPAKSRVTKTLIVGDEPRDIVFAGAGFAFITTARRGQHGTVPPAGLSTPGVPRPRVGLRRRQHGRRHRRHARQRDRALHRCASWPRHQSRRPCHTLPTGTNGFTLDSNLVDVGTQGMKIPHLRNAYDKVGAYDSAGDQVSGFGFLHDGSDYSMFDFLSIGAFQFSGSEKIDIEIWGGSVLARC